jgi:hypothetical protein
MKEIRVLFKVLFYTIFFSLIVNIADCGTTSSGDDCSKYYKWKCGETSIVSGIPAVTVSAPVPLSCPCPNGTHDSGNRDNVTPGCPCAMCHCDGY